MGWLYSTHPQTKDSYVKEILESNFGAASEFTLLDHSLRGSRLWVLVQRDGHEPQIGLFLLQCYMGCWGYKDLDEGDGPYHYDCPLRWLARAPEPAWCPVDGHRGTRRSWRDFVRDHHAQRAADRKRIRPPVGSIIRLGDRFLTDQGGRHYRVTEDLGRKGLMLDGYVRLKARYVKWVDIVNPVLSQSS
jgi:hypothetical protein